MKAPRAFASYLLLVGLPVGLLVWVLNVYQPAVNSGSAVIPPAAREGLPSGVPNLLTLLLQLVIIVGAARLVGLLFRRLQQPQVVGEMAAGILLGPSVFGALLPSSFASVFPVESLGYLNAISQLGLVLFMFVVGIEFDGKLLRGQSRTAVVTSHASITLPFLLGVLVAIPLFERLAPPGIAFSGFALFMGAAMSVTAFPVLARILIEKGLLHTRVGVVALACAAIDDVTAWCMLAGVIIAVRAGSGEIPLWFTIGGTIVYTIVMVTAVRPLMRRALAARAPHGLTHDVVGGLLVFLLLSALATERLGIHALFGAFLAGAVLPPDAPLVKELVRRLEDVTVVFLLPLFFAFTGLRMVLTMVSDDLLGMAALIMVAAIAGKLFGSAFAARLTGMQWREAFAVGTLMNTRGLMELVILNIGLDIGVISAPLFSIMVAMALLTTVMTAPLLSVLLRNPSARTGPER
jgi:Kef-type K+ transport system membrane component KefB